MELPILFKISPDPSLPKRGIQLVVISAKKKNSIGGYLCQRGTRLVFVFAKKGNSVGALFTEKRDELLQAFQDGVAVRAGLDIFCRELLDLAQKLRVLLIAGADQLGHDLSQLGVPAQELTEILPRYLQELGFLLDNAGRRPGKPGEQGHLSENPAGCDMEFRSKALPLLLVYDLTFKRSLSHDKTALPFFALPEENLSPGVSPAAHGIRQPPDLIFRD